MTGGNKQSPQVVMPGMNKNGHPLAGFDSNIQRLYTIAEINAKRLVSVQVFDFLPAVARKALVGQEILTLLSGQDSDVEDARVRELLNELHAANEATFQEEES